MAFIDTIKEKAKQDKKLIVLPESEDPRTYYAASAALRGGFANIIMLGDKERVLDRAKFLKIDLPGITIINPLTSEKLQGYTDLLTDIRKGKGMTAAKAREILVNDYATFGIMMLKADDADGLVSGCCHATAEVLRPALQILKTAPGTELVSGFFILDGPQKQYGKNGVVMMADCALNQDPTAAELAAIAGSCAKTFRALVKDEPIIAMLSHSTKGSAHHPMVDKMIEATRIAKEKYPNLKIDGELQSDAAIDPEIAHIKAPESDIAGKANVLVFPNVDCGNIAYKLVQRLGGVDAYGPMLQGIGRPVNDLSRGCSAEDFAGVIAMTAVQAQLR
ncbi:phosphate acetyltransferase [Lachnospiraceae bacterium ZAX-1]